MQMKNGPKILRRRDIRFFLKYSNTSQTHKKENFTSRKKFHHLHEPEKFPKITHHHTVIYQKITIPSKIIIRNYQPTTIVPESKGKKKENVLISKGSLVQISSK